MRSDLIAKVGFTLRIPRRQRFVGRFFRQIPWILANQPGVLQRNWGDAEYQLWWGPPLLWASMRCGVQPALSRRASGCAQLHTRQSVQLSWERGSAYGPFRLSGRQRSFWAGQDARECVELSSAEQVPNFSKREIVTQMQGKSLSLCNVADNPPI